MPSGIYKITNTVSGRSYVGSAVNIKRRWNEHKSHLRRGIHACSVLQKSWDKHGEDIFVFEIIEPVLLVEDLIPREQFWIDELKCLSHQTGFNISPRAGSTLGRKHGPEARAKISAARTGKKLTDEQKAALSAAQKGHKKSDQARINIGLGQKGKIVSQETRDKLRRANLGKTGRKHTAESRAKISAANIGKHSRALSDEHKAKIGEALRGKIRGPYKKAGGDANSDN